MNMNDGRQIFKMILNIVIPVTGILLVCVLGPKLLKFFMPFVIGWMIAMIANPLVRFLERKLKIVRKHSSVIIVVVVLAAVIGLLYLIISKLSLEFMSLGKELPGLYDSIRAELNDAFVNVEHLISRLPGGVRDSLYRFNENLGGYVSDMVQRIAYPTVTVAGNVAKRIPAAMVYSIVVILSSYFFIVERDKILFIFKRLTPEGAFRYFMFFRQDIKGLIGGYFLAQFRIMFVVAGILVIGFVVLGVPYGLLFAVLIAILDFLPLFGTGTALIPWAFVKLLSGEYAFAAGLILLYILTQVMRQIIQPKIVGDSMGLPPLMTLLFLYLGFKLNGLSGMILAVPIGIVVLNLYKYGAFDSLIENVRLLAAEIQNFRNQD